jgi:hypothetical protein
MLPRIAPRQDVGGPHRRGARGSGGTSRFWGIQHCACLRRNETKGTKDECSGVRVRQCALFMGRNEYLGVALLGEGLSAGKVHERPHHAGCLEEAAMGRMAYVAAGSDANRFAVGEGGIVTVEPVFVPPNADCDARFEVQFFQDMLNVLLHGAGTASQNLSYLRVALSGCDPFHHLKLALR